MLKSSKANQIPLQQACEWYARLLTHPVPEKDKQAWLRWLGESVENKQAWQRIEDFNLRCVVLPSAKVVDQSLALPSNQPQFERRQVLSLFALGGLTAVGGWGAYQANLDQELIQQIAGWGADFKTSVGERQELALVQGGHIWLNTDSAINLQQTAHNAEVSLLKGEIYYQYRDAHQPGLVDVHHPYVQVLGQFSRNLAFSISHHHENSSLAVFAGELLLQHRATGEHYRIQAHQQIEFNARQTGVVQPVEAYRQSWLKGVLVVDSWPLQRVIYELSRYHRQTIRVDRTIQNKRLIGRYPLDQLTESLQMIAKSLNARLEQPRWRAWQLIGKG